MNMKAFQVALLQVLVMAIAVQGLGLFDMFKSNPAGSSATSATTKSAITTNNAKSVVSNLNIVGDAKEAKILRPLLIGTSLDGR